MHDRDWKKTDDQSKILAEFQGLDEELARQLLALRRSPAIELRGRIYALRRAEPKPESSRHDLRKKQMRQRTVLLRGALALLLAVAFLVGLPTLLAWAGTAARGLGDILAGLSTYRSGLVTFTPPPPFVVQQPDQLSNGWRLVAERYAALGGQSGSGISAGPGLPTGANSSDAVRQVVERQRGDFAYITLGYEGPAGRYFVLFERAAQAGESLPTGEGHTVQHQTATLSSQGELKSLVWTSGGTWIELESNLATDELMQIANRLAVSQSPTPSTSAGTPSGMVITSREIKSVSLEEAQAQVTFHIPTFGWVPEGFHVGGAHVSPPDWANIYYVPSDPALAANYAGFAVGITRGKDTTNSHIDGTQPQPDMIVNGHSAAYMSGPSVGELRWEAGGFTFDLSYSALDFSRDEVQRLAESLH